MLLAKVIGNVVSTIKVAGYESRKVLIVQPVDGLGKTQGKSFLAIDSVQAGVGDTVLIVEEGNSARQVINEPKALTVKCVICGIVDSVSVN